MKRWAKIVGVAMLAAAAGMTVLPANGAERAGDEASDAVLAKVKAWTESKFVSFVQNNKALNDEVVAANTARASWAAFSEEYKKWTPEDAEKNKNSYGYCEYVWSVKKDKEFRAKHTGAASSKELKEFQDASGGVISEFFVTDAKGGNVAQTQATSDWFQGDEPKFTDCATNAVVAFSKPKRDETTGETGVHVSVPLFNADKKLTGVAIVLVVADKIK